MGKKKKATSTVAANQQHKDSDKSKYSKGLGLISLRDAMDKAGKVEVCARSGEVSLMCYITRYKKGGMR